MYTTREQDLVYQNEVKEIKLRSLLEITNAINENAPVEHLMKIFTFILKEQLGFSKFVLLMNQKSWENPVKIGYKGKINLNTIDEEFNRFKEITIIESSKSKLLHQFQVIIPVFHSEKPLAFLLLASNLDSENETSYFSFVQTLTNIIAVAVENKRLGEQHIIKERISKELEVAREMQKLLFPSDLPSNRKMDISAKYIPRHAIGGDYYDFIPLGDNEYIICIADVSGKGVSAALLMANFQATIRTLFKYQRFEMPFLLEELNKKVMRSAKGEKFITFFIAHYNAYTRKMQYVNAGHNHPFILNGRKVMMLDKGCIGLGMLDEIPSINVGNIELEPNSTFVLYTDGLIELENTEGEFFGVPLLVKTAQSYAALKMEDMNNII
ncbi:MAG: SpoIIE family protein phosphatase, partial [Crocinitomicaceae bacterium]|nr:SpoIIE family protein phosphatase [Crocinitomicaceae bacterium]